MIDGRPHDADRERFVDVREPEVPSADADRRHTFARFAESSIDHGGFLSDRRW